MSPDLPTDFPIRGIGLRGFWARRDVCPDCGNDLDTGWECNTCGYDAQLDALPPEPKVQALPTPTP